MIALEHSKGNSMKRKYVFLQIVALIIAGCIFQSDETPKLENPLDPNSEAYEKATVSELNIESGQKFYTSEITVTWKGSEYAAEYQCVLGDSTYAWNTTSWIKLTNLIPEEYLFKVTPRNQAGFKGLPVDCLFTLLESPAVDTLSIENGQVFTIPDIEVTWTGNTTATSYRYSLIDQPGEWSDLTTVNFEGLADSTYNLTITAKNDEVTGAPRTWTFIVDTASKRHTISGTVTGPAGVTVMLDGTNGQEARVVDENGTYSFSVPEGTYILTPTLEGYSFEPESVNLYEITTDIFQNFTATINRHTISGTVTDANEVTVQLSGDAKETVTLNDGDSYSFIVDALGSYVVAISRIGYQFTPNIKMFPTLLEDVTQDFRAIQDTYTITGTVTGTDGVTVRLSGDAENSMTVNNGGTYTFNVASMGTYTVSVEKEGYEFNISSRTFESIIENRVQDFVTNPQTFSLAGSIIGTDKVTFLLGGDTNEEHIIVEDGTYSFSLTEVSVYTLTPKKHGYSFEPETVSFDSVTTDITQNFTATLNRHTISGTITGADEVIVKLTGDTEESVTLNDGDSYSFTVDALGSYIVAVSRIGYQFAPNIKMFPTLLENASQNFHAIQDTYIITGTVTGTDNVTVRLSGDVEVEVVVENDGIYSFAVLSLGTYTVSVEKEGVSFPISQETFHYLLRDETQDFVASISDVITISGLVTGLDDVYVKLSGDMDGKQILDDNHRYEFIVDAGGTYTVSVFKEACMFDAYEVTFENITVNKVQNFNGQLIPEKEKSQFLSYAGNDNFAQMIVILDDMPLIHTVKDQYGRTPLFLTAERGYRDTAQLLLGRGADIEVKDNNGLTPLHITAQRGYPETAHLLLIRGADIESRDNFGYTPLVRAVHQDQTETVQLLLDWGADTEIKDSNGRTPLYVAVFNDQTEMVPLLLDSGADIEAKEDISGRTPLHWTAGAGQTETVQLLLDRGADIEAKDNEGTTPLHYAAMRETETVQLLLDRGADIEAKINYGTTPLHYAAFYGKTETVQLLIDRGADINSKDNGGYIPLHWAAYKGETEILQLLLNNGANVNALTNNNEAPLDFAEMNNHTETAEILITAGGKRGSEL